MRRPSPKRQWEGRIFVQFYRWGWGFDAKLLQCVHGFATIVAYPILYYILLEQRTDGFRANNANTPDERVTEMTGRANNANKRERAAPPRNNMITVEHLIKRYGNYYALNDVSFEIGSGEIVGLLGPNGAGKSTTMNILTGYLSPTAGEVTIDGVRLSDDPAGIRRLIGYLPETPPVYPDMTVDEYLNFVYDLKGCKLPREEHLAEIRSVVRLGDVRRRLIRNLSKGYRQRVGIAQALVGDPKVIIFDEPTVGLDPKQILEVRNLIRSLGGKHTVILSTHILAEVQAVCEKIVIIHRGSIIACEKTDELSRAIEDNAHFRYAVLGGQKEVLTALRGVRGVRGAEPTGERDGDAYVYLVELSGGFETRRAIARALIDRGLVAVGIREAGDDLESVFIRLIDRADGTGGKPGKKSQRGANA